MDLLGRDIDFATCMFFFFTEMNIKILILMNK